MRMRPTTLLLLLAALAACKSLSPGEQRTIQRWLLCEECVEGERDSVVALGNRATGRLGEALKGPPKTGRENIRRQAEAMYLRIPSPPLTQQEYVDHYVENYVATYQSRAAVALGLIGTPSAHVLLLAAIRNDSTYRDDVRRALGAAAGVTLSPIAGDSQSAPLDSFARTDPSVLVRDSTTGQALANVRVVFRVDSGQGVVSDSVQRTSPNGTASVRWRVGAVDSSNVLRVVAAGRTVRFHAAGHGFAPRVVFVVQPSNGTVGQPIVPVVRVAVLDPWGQKDTTLTDSAHVAVVGTGVPVADTGVFVKRPTIAGEADFPGLSVNFTGSGLRLRVQVLGATVAFSQPFDVVP